MGPLPHPTRPSLSLASCQLIPTATTAGGLPCCVWSPVPTCHRHHPGRSDGAGSLVFPHRQRPSLCNSQVGACNYCFATCSAFPHAPACTLAESPSDPSIESSGRFLGSFAASIYRVERTRSRAGVAPAEVQRLSRRTITPARGLPLFYRLLPLWRIPASLTRVMLDCLFDRSTPRL